VSEHHYRGNDRRVFWWLLLGLLLLFGGMYAALVLYAGQRLPHGSSVEGIDVGGMRPAAAEQKLSEGLDGRAEEPMTLAAEGQVTTLRPTASGFSVDVPATVARLQRASSWDPRALWDHFAGGTDEDAVVRVDRARLDDAVGAFADQVDQPAVEGAVTFAHGEVAARYPRAGSVVDRDAAAAAVRSAFLHRHGPDDVVALPVRTARPRVTTTAVSDAMEAFGNPAMSGPVVVRLAGEGVQLEPEDYAASLSMQPEGARLVPHLDDHRLVALLRPRMSQIDRAPRDARIVVRAGRPGVVPSRAGVTFRDADVTRSFLDVLTRTGSDRLLAVRSRPARPRFTTAAARRLRVTERVSGFTTYFPYAAYRNVNIPRAAGRIDGTLLKPGETFSMNRTVGERTASNGFTKGFVIADGVFSQELGGGVSQVASTTFNAAFFAGLQDVEHTAHSFYIDRYPVGREATVVWPHTDLIRESVTRATPRRKGVVRVSMYSTKYWDITTSKSARYDATPPRTRHLSGPGCVPNHGYDGFDIDVHRMFYRHGSSRLDHRESMHTHYTPSDSVICS
jgi:vancomycin resistance protein YoaR